MPKVPQEEAIPPIENLPNRPGDAEIFAWGARSVLEESSRGDEGAWREREHVLRKIRQHIGALYRTAAVQFGFNRASVLHVVLEDESLRSQWEQEVGDPVEYLLKFHPIVVLRLIEKEAAIIDNPRDAAFFERVLHKVLQDGSLTAEERKRVHDMFRLIGPAAQHDYSLLLPAVAHSLERGATSDEFLVRLLTRYHERALARLRQVWQEHPQLMASLLPQIAAVVEELPDPSLRERVLARLQKLSEQLRIVYVDGAHSIEMCSRLVHASFDIDRHTLAIDMWVDAEERRRRMTNHLLYALSGATIVKRDDASVQVLRRGLRFRTPEHHPASPVGQFEWLDNAVTAWLTFRVLSTQEDPYYEFYEVERAVLDALVAGSRGVLTMDDFLLAYFEDYDPYADQAIPHWKTLWDKLAQAYGPQFLVRVARFLHREGFVALGQLAQSLQAGTWDTLLPKPNIGGVGGEGGRSGVARTDESPSNADGAVGAVNPDTQHQSPQQERGPRKYHYAVFDPRPTAKETNEKIFASGPVYGIEVTVKALAERCIANLDPQHTHGDTTRAAIEEALTAELPPEGATLATVRADLDSIGAMVVLTLRARGERVEPAMERIRLVAESDKFARGGWPGRRPLPTSDNPWPEGQSPLAAIAAAVSDFRVPIEQRVAMMERWLLTGEEPEEYRSRVERERMEMVSALENGLIRIREAANGRIAVVESTHRAATYVGYSVAPVVVALNPEFRVQGGSPIRKFTISQFEAGYVDLQKVFEELSEREPGWGGSPTIGGSPQGVSSSLTLEEVVEVVERHLLR